MYVNGKCNFRIGLSITEIKSALNLFSSTCPSVPLVSCCWVLECRRMYGVSTIEAVPANDAKISFTGLAQRLQNASFSPLYIWSSREGNLGSIKRQHCWLDGKAFRHRTPSCFLPCSWHLSETFDHWFQMHTPFMRLLCYSLSLTTLLNVNSNFSPIDIKVRCLHSSLKKGFCWNVRPLLRTEK